MDALRLPKLPAASVFPKLPKLLRRTETAYLPLLEVRLITERNIESGRKP
jgi:hypothetical protein